MCVQGGGGGGGVQGCVYRRGVYRGVCTGGECTGVCVQEGGNAMNITLTPTPSHNSILSFTSKPSTTLPQIPTLSPLPSSYYR